MSEPTVKSTSSNTAERMEVKRQRVENYAIACADRALIKQRAYSERKAKRKAS